MSRVRLVDATLDGLRRIVVNLRPEDRRELSATTFDHTLGTQADRTMHCGAFQWMATLDGEPVASIGAMPVWPRVWNVWAFGTPEWPRVALGLTRHVRRFMIPAIVASGAHRAQCMSIEGHQQAHDWLEVLGARKEAVLSGFGARGEDFIVFSWSLNDVRQPQRGQLGAGAAAGRSRARKDRGRSPASPHS